MPKVYDPELILTDETKPEMVAYLMEWGHTPASLAIMPNVQLANAYHTEGWTRTPKANDVQRATAAAILATLGSLPGGTGDINEQVIRAIVRDELERLPAQRLEITGPVGSITLDGPLHYRTELTIKIAALGHPIMLVGPAGSGKTTIGEHTAKALQFPFFITSTITDTHELIGFVDGHGRYHDTPFRNAYKNGGVWIADEIDAWEANALLTANSALANGYCNFPDHSEPITRHADFRMIATANTFGTGADRLYVGRNELDAASLDRFATIDVDYDLTLERMFAAERDDWLERVWQVRKIVNAKKIRHVVSSRAIAMGAAALRIGLDWDLVEAIYLFKGMSSKDREKID